VRFLAFSQVQAKMDIPERTVTITSAFLKGKLVRQDITAPSESDVNSIKIAGKCHSLFTDELVCILKNDISKNCLLQLLC